MSEFTENINKSNIQIDSDKFQHSQNEYTKTLEMAVQLLQREVENLRLRSNSENTNNLQKIATENTIGQNLPEFSNYINIDEVLSELHEFLKIDYWLLESNIFFFNSDKKIYPVGGTNHSLILNDEMFHLMEEGIIDWVVEQKLPAILPNIRDLGEINQTFFIIVPLLLRNSVVGIFAGLTNKSSSDFDSSSLINLQMICQSATISIDNIKSKDEINKMNVKLSLLNNQMIESSHYASIGEIASSIAFEIEAPLQIIKANVKMLETGLGDTKRRLMIINTELEKSFEIIKRLSNFDLSKNIQEKINLCSIIDDISILSESQLLRDGIRIEKNYENKDAYTLGFKSQLENALLNIFMLARDSMPDGGIITVGIFKHSRKKNLISISDNGIGFEKQEIEQIFDINATGNFQSNNIITFNSFFINNIIKQHKGSISVFSEIGKGTVYKILLPSL